MPIRSRPFNLDLASAPFLDHHRVDGTAILPTVMAVDELVHAAVSGGSAAGLLQINGVHVGAPVLVDDGALRRLRVSTADSGPQAVHSQLRSGDGTLHYAATVRRGSFAASGAPPWPSIPADQALSLTAGAIYPPYFHGPLLRVIGSAWVDARGAAARLAPSIAPLTWSGRSTVTAPTLLELVLQTCGLWEAVMTGRMMIPRRIDQIVVRTVESSLAAGPLAAQARVRPMTNGGVTVFDGVAEDDDGRILLEVRGYATADLGRRISAAELRAMRDRLDVDTGVEAALTAGEPA